MATDIAVATGERRLEDEIFQFQKLDLEPPVRQVVEEALQLFAEGRHMEAAALIEKAEAMRSVANGGANDATDAGDAAVDALVADLARGLAEVLAKAVHKLEERLAAETRALGRSIEGRLDATTAAIEHAAAKHDSEVGALRSEVHDLRSSVSEKVDALCARVNAHQEKLDALQSTVTDVSPRVNTLVERLDRQANAIRSIYDVQTLRENALDQLGEALTNLKAARPLPGSVEAQL